MMTDRQLVFENEWFAVRNSGELPEIALHSSLYYLTEDDGGPRFRLSRAEKVLLLEAATRRYQDIVLRDMLPENRGKPLCRGIRRSMENWRRLKLFDRRHHVGLASFRREAARALKAFLAAEVERGIFPSATVNCSFRELLSFAVELGLSRQELPEDIARCFQPDAG